MENSNISPKYRKEQALEMAVTTLKEYRQGNHKAKFSSCVLCKATILHSKQIDTFTVDCNRCMMYPFGDKGCTKRLCRAMSSTQSSEKEIKLAILFWEKVVAKIKRTPEEMFVKGWYKSDWWDKSLKTFDRNASDKLVPVC